MSKVPLNFAAMDNGSNSFAPAVTEVGTNWVSIAVTLKVVHLGRSTCHAISGRGDESTRIPDG